MGKIISIGDIRTCSMCCLNGYVQISGKIRMIHKTVGTLAHF